jgi:hypothetical protein
MLNRPDDPRTNVWLKLPEAGTQVPVPVHTRPDDPRTIDSETPLKRGKSKYSNVLSDNRAITLGDEIIGPMGSQHAPIRYNKRRGKGNFEMINIRGVLK